ncbi:DUF6168 family protein [Tenacibaculum tangerinum]|uniref:DUF6168 family protein n=1 Tax=Tenacibaculum tangerinum TaxID=3038772 RepID=A0ABY8L0C2_9FLAO|nr:DUF6168 family protein [Tenacibaculum tangerinum]WGH74734.1 DUF6168 family protein [Tenacibaculum tangerinum]
MIKRIFLFIATALALFVVSFFLHDYLLTAKNIHTSFSLIQVYTFHVTSAILVYSIVELVAQKLPNQAGYAYLASIFLKIGFFVLIFQATVFANIELTKAERISLVIPLFLFLITEAIGVSKLLNNK